MLPVNLSYKMQDTTSFNDCLQKNPYKTACYKLPSSRTVQLIDSSYSWQSRAV